MRAILLLIATAPGLLACAGPSIPRKESVDPVARVEALLAEILDRSFQRLGQPGGSGKDPATHIGLPDELARAEKILRRYGGGKLFDEVQAGFQHAAEAALPAAQRVFRETVADCFVPDPALLTAGPEAITRRLRARCGAPLVERLQPVAAEVLQRQPVMAGYRRLVKRLTAVDRAHDWGRLDVEGWFTRGVLDGLYRVMAEEERRARTGALK